jgi:hypothetical protein
VIKQTSALRLLLASVNATANARFTIFTKRKFNNTDNILSLGVSSIMNAGHNHLRSEVITSINSVTVIDQFGYK